MKNFLYFILIFITLLISCDDLTPEEKEWVMQERSKKEAKIKQEQDRFKGFSVIVIDGCEYLYKKEKRSAGYNGYGWGYLAHKGNCNRCARIRQQEMKKLINELKNN